MHITRPYRRPYLCAPSSLPILGLAHVWLARSVDWAVILYVRPGLPFAWLSNIRIRAYTCIYRLRLLLRTAHSSNGEAVKDYSRAESPSAVITSAVTSAEPLITLRNIGRFLARVLYSGRWNKRSQTSGAVAPGLAPAERAGRRAL